MNKPGKSRTRQSPKKIDRRKLQEFSGPDEEETVTEPYEPQVIEMLEKVMCELDEIKKSQSNFEQRLAEISHEIHESKVAPVKEAVPRSDSPTSAYGGGAIHQESGTGATPGPVHGSDTPSHEYESGTPNPSHRSGTAAEEYKSGGTGAGYGTATGLPVYGNTLDEGQKSSNSSQRYGGTTQRPNSGYAEQIQAAGTLKVLCRNGLNELCAIEELPQSKGGEAAIRELKKTMQQYANQADDVLAAKGTKYLTAQCNLLTGALTGLKRRLKLKEKCDPKAQTATA